MLVVVTYDENGGQWDEVAPPKADLAGRARAFPPGIISPFARRGAVDHTPYDTGSHHCASSRTAGRCRRCPASSGATRPCQSHGLPPMGDLTAALELRAH